MFSSIADGYDTANRVLSLGVDGSWRRRAADAADVGRGDLVLDVACGTGDLSAELARRVGTQGAVVGADFARPMLARARSKREGRVGSWVQADALRLPFRQGRFAAATIGFGIRNVDQPRHALAEMARVVETGGRVVVLEFGQPSGPLNWPYRAYSRHIMPRVGGWLTGNRAAYEYLPRTAAEFPAGDRFLDLMRTVDGLGDLTKQRLLGGIAWVYAARVVPS